MNRRTGLLIIVAVCLVYHISLGMVCYHFGFSNGTKTAAGGHNPIEASSEPISPPPSASPSPAPVAAPQEKYIVKEYAGRIVITLNDEIVDERETDITMLPQDARERLQDGVEATSVEELAEILEAYSL